jgi:putative intracellular protease/amidase/quinol monooxygenase YgiN
MKTKTHRTFTPVKLVIVISVLFFTSAIAKAQNSKNMKNKILFVVTSHSTLGTTDEKTGFYLSEVTHPLEVLTNAGYEIDFVSPKGGNAPVDGFNLNDETNKKFWNNAAYRNKIENTMKPSEVNPKDYVAIHYAGGHGTMWDFADNPELASIAASIYENGGVISAVCHGPAGLVNIKLHNGSYLVDGKKINAFTNQEEVAVKLDKVVPFLLENALIERGAIFEKSGLWQPHVVNDQRVITGQNPQSAKAVGEALVKELKQLEVVAKITRFELKKEFLDEFRKTLSSYVLQSISDENNIMSEAYFEEENQSIVWLFERWVNKTAFNEFQNNTKAKALATISAKALVIPAKTMNVKDLEPITKEEWRATSKKEDSQLTIILFVDAKKGTETNFKDVYHVAMPQFRSEPGVVTYQLSQLEEDNTQFVTFEKFRSNDAFKYHLNFPPIQPVIDYLNTSIKKQPFQDGIHNLIEFAPLIRE